MPGYFSDFTAIGLFVGLLCAGVYFAVGLVRNKTSEILDSAIICLAVYAVAIGLELISAAMLGDIDKLPPSWRVYIVVASIVVIGLSVDNIIKKARALMQRPEQQNTDTPAEKDKETPPDA